MNKAKRISSRLGKSNPPLVQPGRLKHLRECCEEIIDQKRFLSIAAICSASGIAETTLRRQPYWNVVLEFRKKLGRPTPGGGQSPARAAKSIQSVEMVDDHSKLLAVSARLREKDALVARLRRELREALEKIELIEMPAHPVRPLVSNLAPPSEPVPYWAR